MTSLQDKKKLRESSTMSASSLLSRQWFGPVAALVLIILGIGIISPDFFDIRIVDGHLYGSLVDVVHRGASTALVAVGMAVVIGTRGIDLSVGSVIAISAAVMAVLIRDTDLHPAVIILAALGAGVLCGLWNGMLVAYLDIQPIIATLILMVAGRGIAQMITDGQIVTFHGAFFEGIGSGYLLGIPWRVIIAAVVIGALYAVMRKTALGLFVESVGGNARASRLAGIDARGIKLLAYAISGLCAAFAGIIIAADIRGADANNAGLWLELDAILAVVIGGASLMGGRFFIGMTVIGVLIIQSLTTGILLSGLPSQYTLIVKAAVVMVVLLVQAPKSRELAGKAWEKIGSRKVRGNSDEN
ncbi:MAG: ABC transporter permease [Rhodospirillales bacterium]|jgi:simple sugar transport system permease protein|uniref:Sugar ABC transporter permease n=2 Tax=Thalassospira TaxID=168934 RepID=A0ABR4TKY1_9PROT|nr:sugar ABC transporter permease [Thalassospira permensis NBRC 106175]MAB34263.1 ABC transporter permease [Thalassospira sp.]MBR9781473.1 ABC transporter permease [Rhodospirillales bacterium]MCD1593558.1 ABC transporter permease [Thalassospira xiamenensis]OCK09329.1 ABC-type transporter, integral membrane subunit [Thalassospira sp. KO164]OHZ01593.1 sugar ABC transporter permease [Thalassospira sp. MIT1004]PXX36780.1 monosaccharide ABC transporter membrane protein (CUT2 family) [Thalassospira|tara:strand:+ start:1228 stop:2301 length:1074 start_codon:yes stop_codon:yes gene_type:complete